MVALHFVLIASNILQMVFSAVILCVAIHVLLRVLAEALICLDPARDDRYFEQQSLARCGMHALNNLVGGPQFVPDDLERACAQVVAESGEPVTDHATSTGWFSHSVLGSVLQELIPP